MIPIYPHCSSASANKYIRNDGFTLLELLVVLVMMGVILSFSALSIGDGGRKDQLEREAKRLHALLTMAGEEAVLQARIVGVLLDTRSYRFLYESPDGWQSQDDAIFRVYYLPESMSLQLYMNGSRIDLPHESNEFGNNTIPQLLFYPSSERSPFELQVSYRENPPLSYSLRSSLLGKVSMSLSLDSKNTR